jgi:hypothetical protein
MTKESTSPSKYLITTENRLHELDQLTYITGASNQSAHTTNTTTSPWVCTTWATRTLSASTQLPELARSVAKATIAPLTARHN